MAQVDVLTGPERRRRFSLEQKRALVAAAHPGAGDAVVAAAIEVELSGSSRLRIPASTPPELAAAVIAALRRQ